MVSANKYIPTYIEKNRLYRNIFYVSDFWLLFRCCGCRCRCFVIANGKWQMNEWILDVRRFNYFVFSSSGHFSNKPHVNHGSENNKNNINKRKQRQLQRSSKTKCNNHKTTIRRKHLRHSKGSHHSEANNQTNEIK